MRRSRELKIGMAFLVLAVALGIGSACMSDQPGSTAMAGDGDVPLFEVDPMWPNPLPNHWVTGSTIGVGVDSRDHVWVIHREGTLGPNETGGVGDPPRYECCVPAPPVLEFDPDGNLVGSWGGPGEGYDWPMSNHGITVDHMDNVWIGGNGGPDAQILKFTRHGQFLMQVGRSGASTGSNDPANFSRVAKIFVDPKENEAYISDGYGNKRVVVLDADTGEFKRYWGAYGNRPDDTDLGRYDPDAEPAPQFRNPVHCAELSLDRLLYVCDRVNDRIQVFEPDGTFVQELFVAKDTLGAGSVWDIAFSRDAGQRYLYLADGVNEKIYIIDRVSMQLLSSFGDGGRQPGQFYGAHSIMTDSHGNIYVTETFEGKRVQKFVYKGEGPIRAPDQGVVWPAN